jgi:hypothetical protein
LSEHISGLACSGYQQAWAAPIKFERLCLRADPVGRGLTRCGAGEAVVRRAEGSHEDLRLGDLAGGRVDDRHRAAGVVDEQLLAGDVDLAHRALLGARELAVLPIFK